MSIPGFEKEKSNKEMIRHIWLCGIFKICDKEMILFVLCHLKKNVTDNNKVIISVENGKVGLNNVFSK